MTFIRICNLGECLRSYGNNNSKNNDLDLDLDLRPVSKNRITSNFDGGFTFFL